MGAFADAIALAQITGGPADIAAVRQYQQPRPGSAVNLEQEITADLGVFVRAGWADGNIEPYEYHRRRSHRGGRAVAEGHADGAGRTTRSAWPASSTAFPRSTRNFSTTAASASWSATACCRIPASNRSSRPITRFPVYAIDRDARLSVHRQSRLQRGSRPGLGLRRPPALPVLSRIARRGRFEPAVSPGESWNSSPPRCSRCYRASPSFFPSPVSGTRCWFRPCCIGTSIFGRLSFCRFWWRSISAPRWHCSCISGVTGSPSRWR